MSAHARHPPPRLALSAIPSAFSLHSLGTSFCSILLAAARDGGPDGEHTIAGRRR